jgi:hypothetical protein
MVFLELIFGLVLEFLPDILRRRFKNKSERDDG